MKRKYSVTLSIDVDIEIDDEVTSEAYPGETLMTAHLNRDRFTEGATFEDTLTSIAAYVGVDCRDLSRTDGWADFPDGAATAFANYPYHIEDVVER
jgi:hypothetical protein